MVESISKIENFLFDMLGLALPGFILIFTLISPLYLFEISFIPQNQIDNSYILSGLIQFSTIYSKINTLNTGLTVIIVFVIAYLLGHFIKVFSIIFYEFMVTIFDKSINSLVNLILANIKTSLNKCFNNKMLDNNIYKYLIIILSPLRNLLNKIFSFKSPDYILDNEDLRKSCISTINDRLKMNYPDKWYSIYKLSSIINSQENIKSLSSNFLAKYNSYRSLSFVFLLLSIYYYYLFKSLSTTIPPELEKINPIILTFSLLMWLTFHIKFKRYWMLCGNEILISLFYYLNKRNFNGN